MTTGHTHASGEAHRPRVRDLGIPFGGIPGDRVCHLPALARGLKRRALVCVMLFIGAE